MSQGPLQIKIFDKQQLVFEGEFTGTVLLGRQDRDEDLYKSRRVDTNKWKLVVAGWDERNVSRNHAMIEPATRGKVRVTNLSNMLPVVLPAAGDLPKWEGSRPGSAPSKLVDVPLFINLGPKTVKVQEFEIDDEAGLQSLSELSRPPGRLFGSSGERFKALRDIESTKPGVKGETPDPEGLVRILQDTINVLQDSANADDFFRKAAEAMVTSLGLDNGWVLTWEDVENEWKVGASHSRFGVQGEAEQRPSRQFLNKVRAERKTIWREPGQEGTDSNRSLLPMQAVVASPILDRGGDVIGAVYGDRRQAISGGPGFSKLDALFVEVLAGGVANGLARLEQEARATKASGQFELFFGRRLAEKLRERPDLMNGREAEITILFADIRGFSKIAERLGHQETFEWINETMDRLTECVEKYDGLTLDYIGDMIVAMWGAPADNPEHAALACRAALDMQAAVPELNERWFERINRSARPDEAPLRMAVGIGINTGHATIGNTGSKQRFKYGPLGNTVNLASRVEGTTKYLKAPVVVTQFTHDALPPTFDSRKLCCVEVLNIEKPVYLYEIGDAERHSGDWPDLRKRYEEALEHFNNHDYQAAASCLGNLLSVHHGDGPSLVLLRRAVNGLIEGPDDVHPVWKLSSK